MAPAPQPRKIDALLALKCDGKLMVRRDRIAILEAISRTGSITAGAKYAGFSYKAAWDAVAAMNSLMPRPVLITQAGGKHGGGATVTEEGLRLIAAFRQLEDQLGQISSLITAEGGDGSRDLAARGDIMITSARNAFRCMVRAVEHGIVNAEVTLRLSDSQSIVALITDESAAELGIVPGRQVIALVKSSLVGVCLPEDDQLAVRQNRIRGHVMHWKHDSETLQINLDIGAATPLVAIMPRAESDKLKLRTGELLCAKFNPAHVILAIC